jgi:hypothetical protein
MRPEQIADLVAFWDFQEPAGSERVARGMRPFRLREVRGPIARADRGVWGPHCARILDGQWLRVPRAECGELDMHGPTTRVSLIAWICPEGDRTWQFIAGCWDHAKTTGLRQYALYTCGKLKTDSATYQRTGACGQAHGFISDVGGPTPGSPVCLSYATGRSVIEPGRWHTVGFTYDGAVIRVYVNGVLDELPGHNPFPFDRGIFDGGPDGGDFTVAYRPDRVKGVDDDPGRSRFAGLFGGLAVYRRALSDEEMTALHRCGDRDAAR